MIVDSNQPIPTFLGIIPHSTFLPNEGKSVFFKKPDDLVERHGE